MKAALLVTVTTAAARAQTPVRAPRPDSAARADTVRRDTVVTAPDTLPIPRSRGISAGVQPRAPRRGRAADTTSIIIRPPVSPRRAMLYSLALPGLGQTRLDRSATGAFFVFVEAGALTMLTKSAFDLHEARAFRSDSLLPTSYPVDPTTGLPTATTALTTSNAERNQFADALVRARRLHLEDWFAVIAFNHLISAAEAYVSANLWDLPTEISAGPAPGGARFRMSVRW